jgi:hypothetical protein
MSRDITVRLYIDSTSLSVVHQMADLVASIDRPDVVKVITWLRCPLDEAQLAGAQALYVKQLAAVSPAFVNLVCQLIERVGARRLEIHSNHHHARNGVLPVVRQVLQRRLLAPEQIALDLYDDGRLSLRHRDELAALPNLPQALAEGAAALRRTLLDGAPLAWSLPASYGWQACLETRYHVLRPERMLDAVPPATLGQPLAAALRPMRFDHAQRLGPQRWERYLGFYGLAPQARQDLRAFAADPDAFVFVGMSVWDADENRRRQRLQIDTIAALRAMGLLSHGRMGFKGHPANLDGEQALRSALGESTFLVPARLPLELMMMDGLLPPALGGVISTAYLSLPADRLRFVVCNAATTAECLAQPDVQALLDLGVVTPDRVLPWLQPMAMVA